MKVGDNVKMSDRNKNHLENGVCAYSGMEGIITYVDKEGSFCLDCRSSHLVVPMHDAYGSPKRGVWIYLNGKLQFHRRIEKPTIKSPKWFHKFTPKFILPKV